MDTILLSTVNIVITIVIIIVIVIIAFRLRKITPLQTQIRTVRQTTYFKSDAPTLNEINVEPVSRQLLPRMCHLHISTENFTSSTV